MGRKKIYEEVKGYWVYSIKVPSINKYYIGVSKQQCVQRWRKSLYKNMALEPYLDEWDSMVKTVLVDNLTKEQAYQYEDNIIRALKMNDLCINEQRSGLIASDRNAYNEQWRLDNPDYMKQWQKDNREKWNEYHKQYRLKKKQQETSLL